MRAASAGIFTEPPVRRVAILSVALLACFPGSVAAAQKAGRAYLPPPLPGPRELQALAVHAHVLVELDRARGRLAVPSLRLSEGVLVSRRLDIWRLPSSRALDLVPRLVRAGLVRAVQPDRVRRFARVAQTPDPLLAQEWWRTAVGADQVEPPGPGRPVTLLDSGLDTAHPEFAERPDTNILNEQRIDGEGEDHGTATASVVAAPANGIGVVGVYPQAVLNVWDAGTLSDSDIIAGIEAAIDAGPGIINMSFGGAEYSPMFEEEVLTAFGTGSIVVAAAGNERREGNPTEYPASFNHVLTVAATNRENRATTFSNANLAVDLAAPGTAIPVAVPRAIDPSGFAVYGGTSFAAPIVSGAAAWVWTARPRLDNTQLFDLLRYSARDIGKEGYDVQTGYGLLDLPAALSEPAPATDLQEPNDDVEQVRANGLFEDPTEPVVRPGKPRASFRARLDITEDPEDVYRVWVPARRTVVVTVRSRRDVDVELWRAGTPTVYVKGAKRRRFLIDGSYTRGTDTVAVDNPTGAGRFAYLDVFLPKNGPYSAEYRVSIRTIAR